MKSLKHLMVAIIVLLSYTFSNAQTKNEKTETVKIYGSCDMCKSTIETAGNMKNIAIVDWDKTTKMATISYDSLKTSKEQIVKRIALAGYDSDIFLAPQDTYASLPSCCQYDRAVTTSEVATKDHTMHSNKIIDEQVISPLSVVFNNYFALKNALVKTDGIAASKYATALSTAIDQVEMNKLSMDVHMAWMKNLDNLKMDTQNIADTTDPNQQRQYLSSLSKNLYEVIKISKQETPTYYQFCPMANKGEGANWLSKEQTIENPYYGSQMLSCGKTVEILNK